MIITSNIKIGITLGWMVCAIVFFSCSLNTEGNQEQPIEQGKLTLEQERIRNTKVKFMTRSLDLSEDQAEGFKEVYLQYLDAKFLASQKFQLQGDTIDIKSLDEEEFLDILQRSKNLQLEIAQIESDYVGLFSQVIDSKKLGNFFQIEKRRRENNISNRKTSKAQKTNSRPNTAVRNRIQENIKQRRAER